MNITWNAQGYTDNFAFVHQYGEDVLELIDAPNRSFVVDVGCGNGALTAKLAEKGFRTLGIDASGEMLSIARKHHPNLDFLQTDAIHFSLPNGEQADCIFSNAVFHWIDSEKQDALLKNIFKNLKNGGSLVCEFGGYGCAESVHATLEKKFAENGLHYPRVFYFPTIGEYTPRIEKAGFRVEFATLFERPTAQVSKNGVIDWIHMFVKKPFEGMDSALAEKIKRETQDELRKTLFRDGTWFIDYVRIRLRARKAAGCLRWREHTTCFTTPR